MLACHKLLIIIKVKKTVSSNNGNIMGDKLLLNLAPKSQRYMIIFTVKLQLQQQRLRKIFRTIGKSKNRKLQT